MGKKRKNKGDDFLYLFIAIPIAIIMFFKEHVELAIILGVILLVSIVLVIFAKRAKRASYLRWYYDRDRRIAELNLNSYLDEQITNEITNAQADGKAVNIDKSNILFNDVVDAYEMLMKSNEIVNGNDKLVIDYLTEEVINKFKINATSTPFVFKYIGENNGGYAFYVFPEIILTFLEGPENKIFIAAYKPSALKMTCTAVSVKKGNIVVNDKTQNSIRYYDKYNPIKDAEIISSGWKVVNQDGSRSFRGGLLPQNNPLHFILKYGKITITMGDYSMETSFSRYKYARDFVKLYSDYIMNIGESKSSV